jgi:hypothetical protein
VIELDFSKLISEKRSAMADLEDRNEARLSRIRPWTVEDRFAAFVRMGFRPHGLYVPDDPDIRNILFDAVRKLGNIDDHSKRIRAYVNLQNLTAKWEVEGVPGRWSGQQGVARSKARFRLVAWGRRGGKSLYASREAMGMAITRPRSWVWVAAPTLLLVSRVFDMMEEMISDFGIQCEVNRNSPQSKLIILRNGSRIEGVSLDNPKSAAGAAVDFAIIDEAAQITDDAWVRAILPPLADRGGQALMISSWEGEGGFFHDKAMDITSDSSSNWEMFTGASWDNFFAFPKGRHDPKILEQERETPAIEFLEQYGAIPAKPKNRVYPEFRESVHVGEYPFNPDLPVILISDPSGGANPYAVLAVQDYGDRTVVIDEYYESGVMVEHIAPILDAREWRPQANEMLLDSAWPADIVRWNDRGYAAYGVEDKPKEEESIPFVRRLLRDPLRFHELYRKKMNELLAMDGYPPDADYDMPLEQQKALSMRVEEALSDNNMTDEDLQAMMGTSKLFIDRSCVNTVKEFKLFSYRKRMSDKDPKEKPKDSYDHLMDCLRYYAWVYKRFDDSANQEDYAKSYLTKKVLPSVPKPPVEGESPPEKLATVASRGFLAEMRKRFTPQNTGVVSYLRAS